jgi:hypothetical protein
MKKKSSSFDDWGSETEYLLWHVWKMTGCKDRGALGAVPKSTWGPAVWDALHALAYSTDTMDATRRAAWCDILCGTRDIIPCQECAEEFGQELENERIAHGAIGEIKALSCPENLQQWLWDFHHRVSARIASRDNETDREAHYEKLKEALPENKIRERYMTASQSCGIGTVAAKTAGGAATCLPTTQAFEYAIITVMLCFVIILGLLLHRCEAKCGVKR